MGCEVAGGRSSRPRAGTPIMHRRLQKAFADGKAAVTFVMTGLDEVHRRSAQLHSRGARPVNFEVIKQMYGAYTEGGN